MTLSSPRIVCAAMKSSTGKIVIGPRHYDATMRLFITSDEDWRTATQGFIDQHGNFWDRREAWVIAFQNGQIRRFVGGQSDYSLEEELYSENLY